MEMEKVALGCEKITVSELVRRLVGVPSLSMARQIIATCEVAVDMVPVGMGDEIFLGEEPKEVVITNDQGETKNWLVGK